MRYWLLKSEPDTFGIDDLEKAKADMEFAQKQVPNVKRWLAEASHEGNEYHGRASQLIQTIEE